MNSLGDYFGELASREGKSPLKLAARWTKKEITCIKRCLRNAFERCRFGQKPLSIPSSVTGQALGNKLADHFAARLGEQLKLFRIQRCKGQGYPDRRLERISDHRSYPLELKATASFEPKSTNRVIITCSSGKLRRHFVAPINHLFLTVLHTRKGNKVWIRNFRADFLEPWTKVRVRLEASVSQHLLTQGSHSSFWGKEIEPAKLAMAKKRDLRRVGAIRISKRTRGVVQGELKLHKPSGGRRSAVPTLGCAILPTHAGARWRPNKLSKPVRMNGTSQMPAISTIGHGIPYLSKSDFKAARSCPAKLYYRKLRYPTILDDDPYIESLADGGFMVGKLAQLQYPDGVLVSTLDPWEAVEQTKQLLKQDRVTVFEAAIYHENRLVRIDVLRKNGNTLELIEVKSKAGDSNEYRAGTLFTGTRGGIRSNWRDYLEDVTYQASVLQAAYPIASVRCFLLVPDKAKTARLEGLSQRFRIRRQGHAVEVDVLGNSADLRGEDILTLFPVDVEVNALAAEVAAATKQFLPGLLPKLKKLPSQIGYDCRNCEYRIEDGAEKNGFAECWGSLASVKPHILDLYQLRLAKGSNGEPIVNELVKNCKASLFDIPASACGSAYGSRQAIQLKHTLSGKEWIAPALGGQLAELTGPLHFIDFETSTVALPHHQGMRPFELVAFQWSCHTLTAPGTAPKHQEWINCEQAYPNVEFARSLRETVGDKGMLMTWSNHERTTLRTIADKIDDYYPDEAKLAAWLRGAADGGRIMDMCALAKDGYFHPEMKGSLSIKYVLPSIWRNNAALREVQWFRKYSAVQDGAVLNPYATLPPLPIGEKDELVNEGTGAMRAYQAMLYGEGVDLEAREQWRRLLLQYCELDTMAMVIIFEHWWRNTRGKLTPDLSKACCDNDAGPNALTVPCPPPDSLATAVHHESVRQTGTSRSPAPTLDPQ